MQTDPQLHMSLRVQRTYAVFAHLRSNIPRGVRVVQGAVYKPFGSHPLIEQDRPWEKRCDNGYPNIVFEPRTGRGAGEWRLWYGCAISGRGFDVSSGKDRSFGWLYARSQDGVNWEKPELGLYDLRLSKEGVVNPELRQWGRANNIVASETDGMGIFLDLHEVNLSRRYKAFGRGCLGAGAHTQCIMGVACSPDGIHWHTADTMPLTFAPPQCYDTHQNLIWDERSSSWLLTTRSWEHGVRNVAIARLHEWPPRTPPPLHVVHRAPSSSCQLYSQLTFEFHGVYLGLVAVYFPDPASKHSQPKAHTCGGSFTEELPAFHAPTESRSEAVEVGGRLDRVEVHLAWSRDAISWDWVMGSPQDGGPPFIPLGSHDGRRRSFDSHIVFPSKPVRSRSVLSHRHVERIYYTGGNGPHFGARNTSLGLAELRADGFVGVSGSATLLLGPIECVGPLLVISADTDGGRGGGSLRVGLANAQPGEPGIDVATPISRRNVTSWPVNFPKGVSFEAHVGRLVNLSIEMIDSTLYTVGFAVAVPGRRTFAHDHMDHQQN